MNYTTLSQLTTTSNKSELSDTVLIVSHYINNGRYVTRKFPLSSLITAKLNTSDWLKYPISVLYQLSNKITTQIENLQYIQNNTDLNTDSIVTLSTILTTSDQSNQSICSAYLSLDGIELCAQNLYNSFGGFEPAFNEGNTLINIVDTAISNSDETLSVLNKLNGDVVQISSEVSNEISNNNYIELSTKICSDISDTTAITNSRWICTEVCSNISRLTTDINTTAATIKELSTRVLEQKTKDVLYNNQFCKLRYTFTSEKTVKFTDTESSISFDHDVTPTTKYRCEVLNIKLQQKVPLNSINPYTTQTTNIWIESPTDNVATLLSADLADYSAVPQANGKMKISCKFKLNSQYADSNNKGIQLRARILLYELRN